MSRETTQSGNRHKTLGVLGDGQLGRMFVQAAQRLGFEAVVLAPQANLHGAPSPAAQVSHHAITADYGDTVALKQLAAQCFAVTTEFENVLADSLALLAKPEHHVRVSPKADAVRIAQNRILEKAHFQSCGVPTAPYVVIDSQQQLGAVPPDFYPAILKTARMGYDGKGQVTVRSAAELRAAWQGLSQVACVLERRLTLASECSVLLARDESGQLIHWPVQRNVHVNGILSTTEVDLAPLATDAQLIRAAQTIATDMAYVGVLCIEFFILQDGAWVVNEMAPRPHNSGHVTMDASSLSQFEAQVRVAAGLPLVQPRQHASCVMVNLLGDLWFDGATDTTPREPDWAKVLALGNAAVGVHLHLYGKAQARRARKMGHINVTASNLTAAWQTVSSIQHILH
ncbi:MAG: 5-(carboxyamino)imidazole ribonucleotide synthase [Cytophagales bacterium]|nr:5-(carboxyamino)imidazole ribonucleotide synthase [Cytophagales bacterium]